ncbi:hypothetical protein KIN20_000102 [Parelaphostrongylus tenuis]|uniref:Uncharacterized protein n=1 Tax=Parelaphostrongylus tenuis TaxID=148309 RepID=A0AAD5LVM3_PARTN|nr:hypothetical protein KIN20_000102 [Parelaphostrongylus tenuis]
MAASCGGSAIPFRFEVLPSGSPVLGCASPACFGGGQGGSNVLHDFAFQVNCSFGYSMAAFNTFASTLSPAFSYVFQPGPDGEDGFVRESDLQRTRSRFSSAPAQQS